MTSAAAQDDVKTNWVWLSVIPLGLGAWAPVYAGVRARRPAWCALGAVWCAIVVAGWIFAHAHHGHGGPGGLLLIVGWTGAIATSFALRAQYKEVMSSPFETAVVDAEHHVAERAEAKRLVHDRPEVARELGIGRPDLPNAKDAGLVDVNNAPAHVLESLPGVDDALATRIVEARAQAHGFSSLEDFGAALDLDGNVVEDLRDRVVFLPR